jgi:enamine deaminase RidA (YjgF/YER057c/UK114 family)
MREGALASQIIAAWGTGFYYLAGEARDIYARYFLSNPPARSFVFVSGWHGPFDVEVDCIATV